MSTFLWVIVPYLCLTTFVVGHVWRYRYDKFGWTTRSSQLYEARLLRLGSPLFHFGMLGVVGGTSSACSCPGRGRMRSGSATTSTTGSRSSGAWSPG